MTIEIHIDPEFRGYIPALSDEERAQLEQNLIADGCRDPLTVWGDILVDGHNRFEICTRLGLGYRVVEKDFADREAALDWMDAHQLGRRNLTPEHRTLLLGRRYNRTKQGRGAPEGNRNRAIQLGQVDPIEPVSTAARLAKEHGVSEATVKRAGKFAAEVDGDEELRAAVASGKSVAAVKKARAPAEAPKPEPAPVPLDDERRQIAKLTTEAMIEEIVGLRADLADSKARETALKTEREDLQAKLKEATSSDLGRALGNAQRRADQFAGRMKEHMANAKRLEYRLNASEKRVKELENTPIDMGAP